MNYILLILDHSWKLLLEASIYVLFGILVAGLLKVFLNPASIARHLGSGRFMSTIKAAILGIPIPLCSCGVLPAAAALKKQGASNGAVTAFLISTPESGVDSIAITYALLDPIMTVARPVIAFLSAVLAGIMENLLDRSPVKATFEPDLACTVDGCCDGINCPPEVHSKHHDLKDKIRGGLRYAITDIWYDLAPWFFAGIMVAGIISAAVPESVMNRYLGGGFHSMLLAMVMGIPLYICASASTPIAAALILKGVSPGTALVFLITGPATNVTSLSMVLKILGKRATGIYLSVLSLSAVVGGLILDKIYRSLDISARAIMGQSSEILPCWFRLAGALFLVLISIKPISCAIRTKRHHAGESSQHSATENDENHVAAGISGKKQCSCGCIKDGKCRDEG